MNVYETLSAIQTELSAPKGQFNKFGGYAYRSCEDILEALKPLLKKHKACVTINDEIVTVGDRFYIKATAALHAEGETVTASALAREALDKKGMDAAQVTGSTSSYARKYALNGLFAIDDNKDPDDPQSSPAPSKPTQATATQPPKTAQKPKEAAPVREEAPPHIAPSEASVSHTAPTEPTELDYVVPIGKWAGYKLRDLYKSKGRQYVIAEYNNPESGEKFKKAVEAVEAYIANKK
jgi:hypothetical protein